MLENHDSTEKKDYFEIKNALMPPDKIGGTTRNVDGESYMKFKLHPDSAKTAPGPNNLNVYSSEVTVKRASIMSVMADAEDPEAFMLITDTGRIHVTGVPVDEILGWLKEGREEGDTGKAESNKGLSQ